MADSERREVPDLDSMKKGAADATLNLQKLVVPFDRARMLLWGVQSTSSSTEGFYRYAEVLSGLRAIARSLGTTIGLMESVNPIKEGALDSGQPIEIDSEEANRLSVSIAQARDSGTVLTEDSYLGPAGRIREEREGF